MWSKELQQKTREFFADKSSGFVKSDKGNYGVASVSGDGSCVISIIDGIMPKPTGEELHFANIEEFLAAGWAVD